MKNYAQNFLRVYAPSFFNEAKELLPHIHNLSKKQINKSPRVFVINGTRIHHYRLYLTPDKYYTEANEVFEKATLELLQSISLDDIKIALECKTPEQLKQEAIDYFEELTDIGAEALNDDQALNDPDFKWFAEITLARFFDLISLIEHKSRISDLLLEALDDPDKYLNIAKAASIDPTISRIPEVGAYIEELPLEKKSKLWTRIANEILKPILSNKKNRISALPMLYIGLVDSIGFIDGHLKLSMKEHRELADELGILDDLEDINYFDKLYRTYLKSKSQGINLI
jgi:hypothetical protein